MREKQTSGTVWGCRATYIPYTTAQSNWDGIMKIDIESMSYDELVKLNHRIVARLKFLDSVHTHQEMMRFSPGDQVSFDAPGRGKQFGTLVKCNKKTVTVVTESGQKWKVSPYLLKKVKGANESHQKQGKIIEINK